MEEIKVGNATIRIHGSAERENVERATIEFVKKVERLRREKGIEKN